MATLDPVTMRILWNRLIAIANNQARVLVRAAFSAVLRESEDLSCALFDRRGNMLVQADTGTPGHINTLALSVREFMKVYPEERLEPGDTLITNDPWIGTGHKHDAVLVTPIFHPMGHLVGYAGSVAHLTDVGGRIYSAEADNVFEEGLAIPVMKLYAAGEPNADLFRIIKENIRIPTEVFGDLSALQACNEVAGEKLLEFMAEYGLTDLEELSAAILDRSEAAMRRAIAAVPNGTGRAEVLLDGFDDPLTIVATVMVKGPEVAVDFTGTSPQVKRGINVPFCYTQAYSLFALKCAIAPEIPNNSGAFRPFRIHAPEGCLLAARFPAPVAIRHISGHFTVPAVYRALAQLAPERVMADSSRGGNVQLSGTNPDGSLFVYMAFSNGGMGARSNKDGIATVSYPANVSNTPVEMIENGAPVQVLELGLRPDSAGAGQYRGGHGKIFRLRMTSPNPVQLACRYEQVRHPPRGLCGGLPGACTIVTLDDGSHPHPKKKLELAPGTEVNFAVAGGGGFGPPAQRSRALIAEDIRAGLLSPEKAARDYGWTPEP